MNAPIHFTSTSAATTPAANTWVVRTLVARTWVVKAWVARPLSTLSTRAAASFELRSRGLRRITVATLSSLLMIVGAEPAAADRPKMDRVQLLDERHGLSHPKVWDVEQDDAGFYWIATNEGLNRYDGFSFKVFSHDPEDPTSIPDDIVFGIFEDSRSRLWLYGMKAFSVLNASRKEFRTLRIDREGRSVVARVGKVIETDEGTILAAGADGLFSIEGDGPLISLATDLGRVAFPAETEDFYWFVASPGLFRLSKENGERKLVLRAGPLDTDGGALSRPFVDSQDRLWIGSDRGVWRIEPSSQASTLFSPAGGKGPAFVDAEDEDGILWAVIEGGLAKVDPATETLLPIYCDNCRELPRPKGLIVDSKNAIWAKTPGSGVLRLGPDRSSLFAYQHNPRLIGSISGNRVPCIFEDRSDVFWICTHSGVNKYDPRNERFNVWDTSLARGGLAGGNIQGVFQEDNGVLWVGTVGHGLNRVDRHNGTTEHFKPDRSDPSSLSHSWIRAMDQTADGSIWIATPEGLDRIRPGLPGFEHFKHDPLDPSSLSSNTVTALKVDQENRLWIATARGLDLRLEDGSFEHIPSDSSDPDGLVAGAYHGLLASREGEIWVTSITSGVSVLDPETKKIRNLVPGPEPGSIQAKPIVGIAEGPHGTIWLGYFNGGLERLEGMRVSKRYREEDGLPSNSVLGIVADRQGILWMSTSRGISRFDPVTERFSTFDSFDGLPGDVFSVSSNFQTSEGEIFFGGVDGLVSFFPDSILTEELDPRVVLTGVEVLYRTSEIERQARRSWDRPVHELQELTLDHSQYVVEFQYSALDIPQPGRMRFRHRLVGFESVWNLDSGNERRLRYSNLDAGDYILEIQARDRNGKWSTRPASLNIRILPAPWETWWAYSAYSMVTIGLIFGALYLQRRKLEQERRLNSRLKRIDRLKDEFLANTSHELRTPLYGMTGLAESLLNNTQSVDAATRGDLKTIVASGRRLASLVDNILDFAKLSRQRMTIRRQPTSFFALGESAFALLRPLAAQKGIDLVNRIEPDLDEAHVDGNRIQQVLINLIGNSIKFTDVGTVELIATVTPEKAKLEVRDTGVGIPTNKLKSVFEPFEQVDGSAERAQGGTGLGLAISKQLVELHGGTLEVESEEGKGTSFTIHLPLADVDAFRSVMTISSDLDPSADGSLELDLVSDSVALRGSDEPTSSTTVSSNPDTSSSASVDSDFSSTQVLVVDDEPIVRQVLEGHLRSTSAQVTSVASGVEALRILDAEAVNTQAFNLVLLDVMMPSLSGYETCRRIREKWSSNDLPIVFLTAKTQVEDLVAGFSAGGNDYLTKPIAREELLARVALHLELQATHRKERDHVAVLQTMLPMCMHCKSVRDDEGYWNDLEEYLDTHGGIMVSHGLCPQCAKSVYPDLEAEIKNQM